MTTSERFMPARGFALVCNNAVSPQVIMFVCPKPEKAFVFCTFVKRPFGLLTAFY